jgi:polyphenol oxidase
VNLFQFQNLSQSPGIYHFISSRKNGVSKPPFESLNLGYGTIDHVGNVRSNWKILSEATQIPLNSFVIAHQIHQGNVVVADQSTLRGAWANPDLEIQNTDAFITKEKNICLIVKAADCVPILIYDPELHVVAAIHAGWRGTVRSVTANTIATLINDFKCKPENLIIGIGPSIGSCCYETGAEVEEAVLKKWGTSDKFLIKSKDTLKTHFDLWYANSYELLRMGVRTENIEIAGICTKCNSDIYFSSRATGGITGRFCAGIMLR